MERRIQRAEREQQRKESRAFDERMRQARADRERRAAIRRKTKMEDEDRRVKMDLIKSLAAGKGVGMFGPKVPRINKFILHGAQEEKDPATGKVVRLNELGFDAQIDPEHVEGLRRLASATRDEQAARALALQRTGRLPKKTEQALSDLASDDFPAFSRMAMAATGAEPDIPMPDPITGGPFVPPEVGIGGPGPGGEVPAAPAGGDIDITQLAQRGIIGPGPGQEQAAAPIQNIHEIIAAGGLGGRQARGKQQDFAAFESAMQARGIDVTPDMVERFFKAEEKAQKPTDIIMAAAMAKGMGLDPAALGLTLGKGTTAPAPTTPTPTAPAPAAPARPAAPAKPKAAPAPTLREEDLATARQQFLAAHPGRTIQNIELANGIIRITDDTGKIWRARLKG